MPQRRTLAVFAAVLLFALDARAQSAGEALKIILSDPSTGQGALDPTATDTLAALLLNQTTTFPIGSSAGGFSWVFDVALGAPTRRTPSFGPMFAERPFTTGHRRLNVGVTFQHTAFLSVAGQPLSDLKQGSSYNNGESFYIYASSLSVDLNRVVISATYGIGERVDIGLIVPIGHASVSGESSYAQQDNVAGSFTSRTSSSGSSSGIGDVIARAKAVVFSTSKLEGAVGLDLHLPTGDPDKLLGTGHTQAKLLFIAATSRTRLSPHVNLGYTFGGSGLTFDANQNLTRVEPSQEFDYTLGADMAVTPSITIAGDVIGRSLQHSATITFFDSGTGSPDRAATFGVDPGTLNLLLGAAGVKIKVGTSWLVTGTILFPLNGNGVKPGVTPVFGFERTF